MVRLDWRRVSGSGLSSPCTWRSLAGVLGAQRAVRVSWKSYALSITHTVGAGSGSLGSRDARADLSDVFVKS